MKVAVKRIAGRVQTCSGGPWSSMRPAFMTTRWSTSAIASSWSCVTWTKAVPTLFAVAFSSSGICRRSLSSDQTCDLTARLRDRGEIRDGIDVRSVRELIFNNMNMMFIEFVKREGATMAELRVVVRRQNRILVQAITRSPVCP